MLFVFNLNKINMTRKRKRAEMKVELKVEPIFELGQTAFAKVKGFPEWPVKIVESVGNNRYGVHFYGTNEWAVVSRSALKPYNEETKAKYINEKLLKRKFFREAFMEAEDQTPQESNEATMHEDNIEQEPESEEVAAFRISKLHVLNNPYKIQSLRLQEDAMITIKNIRLFLSTRSKMNFKEALKCLEHCTDVVLPHVSRFTIFKYPVMAQTFIDLCNFLPLNIDQDDVDDIEKIKSIAKDICEHFKVLFEQNNEQPFQIVLDEREALLQPNLKLLSKEDLFEALTMEELEAFIDDALKNTTT